MIFFCKQLTYTKHNLGREERCKNNKSVGNDEIPNEVKSAKLLQWCFIYWLKMFPHQYDSILLEKGYNKTYT